MIKLLLVEDNTDLSYMIQSGLEDIIGGYEVMTAVNGEEGLKQWREGKPEVIISDIDMPVMNGFDMVKKIREVDKEVLIMFATALASAKDVCRGYEVGVDNYVKKPFIAEELNDHIQALLRRKNGQGMRDQERQYKVGRYMLNAELFTLKDEEGNLTTLGTRGAGILELLCQSKGDTVKKDTILEQFWGIKDFYTGRSLDVVMNGLRKSLAGDSSIEIRTVRGVGYILRD